MRILRPIVTLLVIAVLCAAIGACGRRAPLACPADMAFVAAGQVASRYPALWAVVAPPQDRPRAVGAFCMDRYEFPNHQGERPLVHVSWAEAVSRCAESGKRLCREDEWELACTGGHGNSYSYGSTRAAGRCNADQPQQADAAIAPAGSRPECRNAAGVYDLNGNVSEWVATTETSFAGTVGVLRGDTAWPSADYGSSCWSRHAHPVVDRHFGDDGFRCCADVGGRQP